MSGHPTSKGKKRKYGDRGLAKRGGGQQKALVQWRRRAAPGILWTCETGRERKCLHQGLEILQHYLEDHRTELGSSTSQETAKADDDDASEEATKKKTKLSFEEELALLKNPKSPNTSQNSNNTTTRLSDIPFQSYDTGCRGSVFVLCTMPGCSIVKPPPHSSKTTEEEKDDDKEAASVGDTDKDDTKTEQVSTDLKQDNVQDDGALPPWDPVQTVSAVLLALRHDGKNTSSYVPSSRFILRMIPIQATCFTGIDEIVFLVEGLVKRYMSAKGPNPKERPRNDDTHKTATTFAVHVKKRHCTHIRTQTIIESIVKQIGQSTNWKVDLKDPDATIWVEICQSICGISVLPSSLTKTANNFNLQAIAEKAREKGV